MKEPSASDDQIAIEVQVSACWAEMTWLISGPAIDELLDSPRLIW